MTNINISNISKCEVFPQTAMLLRLGIEVRIGMSRHKKQMLSKKEFRPLSCLFHQQSTSMSSSSSLPQGTG